MSNIDIRTIAAANGVQLWRIADALGMADHAFSRKLRKELPQDQKKQIFEIIAILSKAKKEEESQVRDHPDIERLERTGETGAGLYPRCPVCGGECEKIFRSKAGFVVGCEECVSVTDAWEDPETIF